MTTPETEFIKPDTEPFGDASGYGLDHEGRPLDESDESQSDVGQSPPEDSTLVREELQVRRETRRLGVLLALGGATVAGLLLYSGLRGGEDDQAAQEEAPVSTELPPAEPSEDTQEIPGLPPRPSSAPVFGDNARDTTLEAEFGAHQYEFAVGENVFSLECAATEGFVISDGDTLYDMSATRLSEGATIEQRNRLFAATADYNVEAGYTNNPDLLIPGQEVGLLDNCVVTTFGYADGDQSKQPNRVEQSLLENPENGSYVWVYSPETGDLING